MTTDPVIRRALVSVYDKTGVEDLCKQLFARGIEIISTGGTAQALREAGLTVIDVSDYTGSPEILGGRVKTLHPMVHGGLLARRNLGSDLEDLAKVKSAEIDCLIVNLYPFTDTVASGAAPNDCIEMIDIGGPSMLRSAAKNHRWVTVVSDPSDYPALLADLEAHEGATTLGLRKRLACKAFEQTATYDRAIADWFAEQGASQATPEADVLPDQLEISIQRLSSLRYGENPHQQAALYRVGNSAGVATARQHQGKPLSYNNVMDADAAFRLVEEFSSPAAAIIKHANPCGVAISDTLVGAWKRALSADPVSAFGGVIACNRLIEEAEARLMIELFAEVLIAPGYSEAALEVFSQKPNLRVLETERIQASKQSQETHLHFRAVSGGLLLQEVNTAASLKDTLKVVTKLEPSERQVSDLMFAERVVKHLTSNAIVFVRDGALLAAGAGQTSRVDSCRIAISKATERGISLAKSSLASDAFFPFADGLSAAVEAGATAIIQPGGSVRDKDVIATADEVGISMVFTGLRHFRH